MDTYSCSWGYSLKLIYCHISYYYTTFWTILTYGNKYFHLAYEQPVYAKAGADYEEFKRISKNNLHESSEKTSPLCVIGDNKVKNIDSKPLQNGGRSVLTYK